MVVAALPRAFYRIPFGPPSWRTLRGFGRKAWFSTKTATRLIAILAIKQPIPQTRPMRVKEGERSGEGEPSLQRCGAKRSTAVR